MQELNAQEVEEVSGAANGAAYYIGAWLGKLIGDSRVADDEWAWSGGG